MRKRGRGGGGNELSPNSKADPIFFFRDEARNGRGGDFRKKKEKEKEREREK